MDSPERRSLEQALERRLSEWSSWERTDWGRPSRYADGYAPLLRTPGDWYPPEVERVSWPTPMTMRNVDAECVAEVTNIYAARGADKR